MLPLTKIMVFGTFDVLHKGHLNFFRQARALSKKPFLTVSVARDVNVERIKGKKSKNNEKKRLEAVKKISFVNKAVLGGVKNYLTHILKEKPEIIALGYDQKAYVVGLKNVTMNESFFVGHFPGAPVMPGVIIVEAMAQTGGILILSSVPDPENYLTYFMKIDNVKFKYKVLPGDTLIFKCDLITPIRRGICHMQAHAYANGKLVAEAELMAQIAKKQ